MDVFTVIIIIIACILGIGIPGIILYFSYNWLTKKVHKKIALVSVFLIAGYLLYSIYIAIYPNDSFFKDEYKDALNVPFPVSGKIISKDAGYPDQHGHYCSCSVIETNPQDFGYMYNLVKNNIAYTNNSSGMMYTDELSNIFIQTKNLDTNKMLSFYNVKQNIKNKVFIGFLIDKKRIIFQRCNF